MHARAGGSAAVPEGDLTVRLYDAAIGSTALSQAQASAALDKEQRLQFDVDLVPMETRSPGHMRVSGVVPLKPAEFPGRALCVCVCFCVAAYMHGWLCHIVR